MTAFWSKNQRLKVLHLAFARVITLCFLSCVGPGGSVAAASELRFLTVEEPPTNYLENGEVVGTSVDLVRELARRLDETIDIELLPPARAILVANTTANRILFTAALTEARKEQGYHAIGPVITRKHVLYARKGRNLQLAKLDDLIAQNLTVSGNGRRLAQRVSEGEGCCCRNDNGTSAQSEKAHGESDRSLDLFRYRGAAHPGRGRGGSIRNRRGLRDQDRPELHPCVKWDGTGGPETLARCLSGNEFRSRLSGPGDVEMEPQARHGLRL